jgi:hypothetical protein
VQILDPRNPSVRIRAYAGQTVGGSHGNETGDRIRSAESFDVTIERKVAETIAVVGEEHLIVGDPVLHLHETLTDIGGQSRIDEADPPTLDILSVEVDIAPIVAQGEIV